MNSDQLRQFRAIAEFGNITKASKRLFISQPALSTALAKLEAEVGQQLFVRDGRSMRLTRAGEELMEYAITATDAIYAATEHFAHRNDGSPIRLYRTGGVGGPLLLEGCHKFERHTLNTSLVRNRELPEIMASGEADIIIADDRHLKPEPHGPYACDLLFHQLLLLCVAADDPMANRSSVTFGELADIRMIGRTNPLGFNAWLDNIKAENHVRLKPFVGVDNVAYLREREQISMPYLMGSFGVGSLGDRTYFESRRLMRVTGTYTERDIFIWYHKHAEVVEVANMILGNARRQNEQDERYIAEVRAGRETANEGARLTS